MRQWTQFGWLRNSLKMLAGLISPRFRLDFASATPWLRSPASIVARRVRNPHSAPRRIIYYNMIVSLIWYFNIFRKRLVEPTTSVCKICYCYFISCYNYFLYSHYMRSNFRKNAYISANLSALINMCEYIDKIY